MKKSIEVKTAANLSTLLRAFPDAEVTPKITGPNEDCWNVTIDLEKGTDAALYTFPIGPNRVVVSAEGEVAVSTTSAPVAEQAGIVPDRVLIRNDGWTLGYRMKDRKAAFATWEGEWLAEVDLQTGAVVPLVGDREDHGGEAHDCPVCGRLTPIGEVCPEHPEGREKRSPGFLRRILG